MYSKAQSSKSDILLFILALAIGASLALVPVSAAVAPNEALELQQLTNEKFQPTRGDSLGRQQVSANDLPAESREEAEPPIDKRQQQPKFQVPAALAPLSRQQQQQQPQKLVSQGVINGNHATYVEPPADFKPIIYDHEKQLANRLEEVPSSSELKNSELQQHQATGPATVDPLMATDLQRQQPGIVDVVQQSRGERGERAEESFEASAWLKPSIGRWNDWHDMSIEPDLASSDSSASHLFYQPQYVMPLPVAPYRTRYGPVQAKGDYVPPQGNKGAPMQPLWLPLALIPQSLPPAQLPLDSATAQLDEQQRLEQAAFLGGQAIGRIALPRPAKPQWIVKRLPAPVQKARTAKGGQQKQQAAQLAAPPPPPPSSSSSAASSQPPPSAGAAATSFPLKGSKLPLNLISSGKTSELDLNQQPQQAVPWQPIPVGQQGTQSNPLAAGKQLQQPQWQRRLKRRRKSKINAEVRIQQLVAASHPLQLQQQQPPLNQLEMVMPPIKQVNGLAMPTNQRQAQPNVDQEEQPQVNGQQQQLRQQEQTNIGERVPSKQQPQRPMVVVKRFGSFPLASQSSATNSTATVGNKRVVRGRRVKTLLPVGLSSWFLGGIRDLDGRHWQLPADVARRLAINDVDFSNYQAPKVGPPAAESVVLIGAQSIDQQVTPSAEPIVSQLPPQQQQQSTHQRTVPISQLIPR